MTAPDDHRGGVGFLIVIYILTVCMGMLGTPYMWHEILVGSLFLLGAVWVAILGFGELLKALG